MKTFLEKSLVGLRTLAGCLVSLAVLGCTPGPAPEASVKDDNATPPVSLEMAAEDSRVMVDDGVAGDGVRIPALEAFQQFAAILKGELEEALATGGPTVAVEVCNARAPEIAAQVSEQVGFNVGRSSHRFRNPENAPEGAIQEYLSRYRDLGADAPVEVYSEGEDRLVVAPIVTGPVCLTCHGDPAKFSPELASVLAKNYPDDTATGFEAGDLRGVFWARIPLAP